MILILDNYDSFTFNLYQFAGTINPDIEVIRNDEITVEEIIEKKYTHIIISPGPGHPKDAGISVELVKKLSGEVPLLGVCLGHQSIGYAFDGIITHAPELVHGKSSLIYIKEDKIFSNVPKQFKAARYHSLIIKKDSIAECFDIIAETEDQEIMAIKHKEDNTYGLQFHPESILTENGMEIIKNFLNIKKIKK